MKRLYTNGAVILMLLFLCSTALAQVAPIEISQSRKLIDNCEATTGWTALSNDTTGIATDLDHVAGKNSLEADAVDGAAGATAKGIQKTLVSMNLKSYVSNGGYISYSIYLSATTDIAYCFVRLGTSSSHYNEWITDDDSLAAGWNYVRHTAYEPYSAGNTGNGVNWLKVKYVAIGCEFDAQDDTLADMRFDNIEAIRGLSVTSTLLTESSDPIIANLIAMAASLVSIDTDTAAMVVDLAAIEVTQGTIAGDTTAIQTSTELKNALIDDDEIDNCDDLAASSEQYTLPLAGDWYEIRVTGNCASVLCGANPTATTAKNGHWIKVCDGVPFKGRLSGTKCAHIATTAVGEICYIQLNSAL